MQIQEQLSKHRLSPKDYKSTGNDIRNGKTGLFVNGDTFTQQGKLSIEWKDR